MKHACAFTQPCLRRDKDRTEAVSTTTIDAPSRDTDADKLTQDWIQCVVP